MPSWEAWVYKPSGLIKSVGGEVHALKVRLQNRSMKVDNVL